MESQEEWTQLLISDYTEMKGNKLNSVRDRGSFQKNELKAKIFHSITSPEMCIYQ